jgi:hypothetical protein
MIIYFSGSRLDHGDADQTSTTEADALARRTASPPVVVRGYDSAGNPIARIRAGNRIDDAVEIAASDVTALASWTGRIVWQYPVYDVYGAAKTGVEFSRWSDGTGPDRRWPAFDFRPSAMIPMPDGHLFCPASPLPDVRTVEDFSVQTFSGYYRDYARVYRRAGDQVQGFPALHGGPIHDAAWDSAGNCFIAGDEVGENHYSFRKYNASYALQWSVSFRDYWPLSTVAVRNSSTNWTDNFAQIDQRRASVKIEIAPDGSLYVISEIAWTHGTTSGGTRLYQRKKWFAQISRVSSAGAILWSRVVQMLDNVEPSRRRYTCKALGTALIVFFRSSVPDRYSEAVSGGDYAWDAVYQSIHTTAWTYQQLYDHFFVDKIDPLNGWIISEDGDLTDVLLPSSRVVLGSIGYAHGITVDDAIYPESFQKCIMSFANDRMTVLSQRYRWTGDLAAYNVDPQYVKHVFYHDLTTISAEETAVFDATDSIAADEEGNIYQGKRVIKEYLNAFDTGSYTISVYAANHFSAMDDAGDPIWAGITATAAKGVNQYGVPWREYGRWRTLAETAGQDMDAWADAHDDFVQHTTAHGALASGDFIQLTDYIYSYADFWLPASDLVIDTAVRMPSLPLPVFLRSPAIAGETITHPPALAVPLALRLPTLQREYVGAPVPLIFRVQVGSLEIPFSSIFAHRSPYVLTLSIVCPALPDATVATILDEDDPLSLYFGVQLPSGAQLEPWLSVPLTGITHDQGGRSGAVTLKALAIPDAHAGRIRSMPRRYTTQTRDDLRTWVGPLDLFLRPGDTVTQGAESWIVGQIDVLINPMDATMTVREATG